jgi:hypothetical protein
MSSTLRDDIAEPEQALRVRQAGEGPGAVVVVEAGVENSYHAKAIVLRHHAEGSEFALRAGDQHHRADGRAEIGGHVFAENDGWHRGDTLLDAREGGGRLVFGIGRPGIGIVCLGAGLGPALAGSKTRRHTILFERVG